MAVVAAQEDRADPAPGAGPRDETDTPRRGRSRAAGWWLAALAALTVILGLAIPLAPVVADDPVVTWPRAGAPATSTSLPLTPYRPLSLTADVPCAALRPGGDALRTQPDSAGTPGRGLAVVNSGGRVVVTSSGDTLLDELLPLGDCTYRIVADQAGTRVERDGEVLVDRPGALVPQVAQLATDAPGTPGLRATVHADDRYSSVPSTLKLMLLVLHALALAATLVLATRRWRGRGPAVERPRFHPADAVVLLVSAAWVVLGPLQNDDSWYLLMARGATPTGYIGNQIYMFNTTENPFVFSQYLMALWGHLGEALGLPGWGLLWMRLLPLVLGLVTWWLLRTLLVTVLGRAGRLPAVAWALLLAHLAWWLPYGMALRPEVVIVPLSAAVLVLAEVARRREAVGPLIPATALAALAVSVSPSGLVAAAPVVVALPWLWRWLVAHGWRSRLGAAGAVVAAGTIAIPIGFGDATLGDVVEATAVHSYYYLTFPWYEEWAHYRTLIETGTWGRRLPVLLTVVLLVVVSIGSGRRGPAGGRLRDATLGAAVTTAVALGLLALTPTKWVNHFGAVAAPATVLLALTLLRSPLPRRAGALVTGASVALLTGATVFGFAGPNVWKPYSDRGQPFGDHLDPEISMLDLERLAPHWGEFYLRDVWWWLLVAALAGGWLAWRRRARRRTFGVTPERAVLVTATGMLVGLMVAVMVVAPLRQSPGWTVAGSQLQALTGRGCGLGEAVSVMARTERDVGAPTTPEVRTGDFALAADDPAPVPPPASGAVWHDQVELVAGADPSTAPGVTGLGTLTTGWYPLPAVDPADDPEAPTHLVVPVAGNDPDRQRIVVQFGSGDPRAPVEAESIAVTPVSGFTARQWQEIPVQLPGSRPSAVRLQVEDRVAGPESALAVAAPQLARMQPVSALTEPAARATPGVTGGVFADQLSAVLWPCVDQVAVRHGIAPTPTLRLIAAENTPEWILANPTFESWGGTMVQSERTWATVRPFSAITPGGVPALLWGNVDRIVYDHPTDGYDLTVGQVTRGGLDRFATLASEAYSGREYIG
ncbi:arabinosyltransferase domain-containing protein [Actinomycetospora cinnamomea]|uniref:EmbC-like arabinotransferase in arabinogalactan biosynthesis n=1 Tax=Actinomycetospora cinnamomea TaxID=663609 RepID=A0A2U1FBF0_9PSEU|nr:arabinosyltransferase domain-containing protein [Actinomycetospora cinnamomea]PVZ09512.1 EmbC-like arabinotransferase in arabinogalactan biosynthesis [Actinomycetospora cinnamomea]